MTPQTKRLDAAGKIVKIMDLLCSSQENLSIRDIEEITGISRSTVHRFLTSLEEQEWVYRDSQSEKFRPGIRFFLLNNKNLFYEEITQVAAPIMRDLVDKTGKTAILSILEGLNGLCIHTVEPPMSVKFVAHKGMVIPAYYGATGKVLLAFCREETRKRMLSEAKNKGINVPELIEEIDKIRTEGYAYSKEEWIAHAGDISVPVFDRNGNFVAQLGIAGLASDFEGRETELLNIVREASERMSKEL